MDCERVRDELLDDPGGHPAHIAECPACAAFAARQRDHVAARSKTPVQSAPDVEARSAPTDPPARPAFSGIPDEARESRARREQLGRAASNQQREIAKTQRFIDRFRAQANKASLVQSRVKQLAKVERIELEDEDDEIGFRFP